MKSEALFKKLFTFITLLFAFSAYGQQVTLYDTLGTRVAYKAYIDFDEEAIIFLWDGTRTAYIEEDRGEWCIWGFNREFLGWYENGNIYDRQGYKVASQKEPRYLSKGIEPIKGIRHISPLKPITPITKPRKPLMWKPRWSSFSLDAFLEQGKQ